jgi:hypothetical protein
MILPGAEDGHPFVKVISLTEALSLPVVEVALQALAGVLAVVEEDHPKLKVTSLMAAPSLRAVEVIYRVGDPIHLAAEQYNILRQD